MKSGTKKSLFLDLLLAKYRADPKGFRGYLPEVAQALDSMFPLPRRARSPFGLTDHERTHREQSLCKVLGQLEQGSITHEDAVRGLEHCAVLIEDDTLPPRADHETLIALLRAVLGKSPRSVKTVTTIPVREGLDGSEETPKHISVVRGVVLNLTGDMRLVSISISPRKMQQRRKVLCFVGIATDSKRDVAQRHDDYLTEMDPHAAP